MERLAKWNPYPGTKPDTNRKVLVNFHRTLRDGTLEKSVLFGRWLPSLEEWRIDGSTSSFNDCIKGWMEVPEL